MSYLDLFGYKQDVRSSLSEHRQELGDVELSIRKKLWNHNDFVSFLYIDIAAEK